MSDEPQESQTEEEKQLAIEHAEAQKAEDNERFKRIVEHRQNYKSAEREHLESIGRLDANGNATDAIE